MKRGRARVIGRDVHGSGLKAKLVRVCRKCQAQPGHPCKKDVGGRVGGKDVGGGYVRFLVNPHKER